MKQTQTTVIVILIICCTLLIIQQQWRLTGLPNIGTLQRNVDKTDIQISKQPDIDEKTIKIQTETVTNPMNKFNLTIWCNDFHISPIQDLKSLLQPMGVKFIDKSLSGHCHLTKTCPKKPLKVISQNSLMNLNQDTVKQIYQAYKDDQEMKTVDIFLCFHPASACEAFVPFRKPMLVIATTRYELGRFDKVRWKSWNDNLRRIANDSNNLVGANNKYDLEYIRYFTGIQGQLMESYCGYISHRYDSNNVKRQEILVAPIHQSSFVPIFDRGVAEAKKRLNTSVSLVHLRTLYPRYEFSDLTNHSAIVHVPYQVSVMSLFEQYRMNIPLFFPSEDLLATWQYKYTVMNERTWHYVNTHTKPSGSVIPGVNPNIPDPNSETNLSAIKHWIKYADFYQWPHITYYNSFDELLTKGSGSLKISEKPGHSSSEDGPPPQHVPQRIIQKLRNFTHV